MAHNPVRSNQNQGGRGGRGYPYMEMPPATPPLPPPPPISGIGPRPDVIQQAVPIPQGKIGWIVGKKGTYISQLSQKSGATIVISDSESVEYGIAWKYVMLSGTGREVDKAKKLLHIRLERFPGGATHTTEPFDEDQPPVGHGGPIVSSGSNSSSSRSSSDPNMMNLSNGGGGGIPLQYPVPHPHLQQYPHPSSYPPQQQQAPSRGPPGHVPPHLVHSGGGGSQSSSSTSVSSMGGVAAPPMHGLLPPPHHPLGGGGAEPGPLIHPHQQRRL